MSKPFALNSKDFIKGIVTAVYAGAALGAFAVLQGIFGAPGFDLFTLDWGVVMHNAVNAAAVGAEAGFSGYVIKNFFSDQDGKALTPMGSIG